MLGKLLLARGHDVMWVLLDVLDVFCNWQSSGPGYSTLSIR